jgi:RNA polymerase sigma-70 factor, ECF subfamily
MPTADIHCTIDAVCRMESAKLIASLARLVRDVGLAEDLAQDAPVIALERWPESGVPRNPGAWLMATAKHRAIDGIRRNGRLARKHAEIGRELGAEQQKALLDFEAVLDDPVGDDLLRLMFQTCHPLLSVEGRVALTLRLLGGLKTEAITRGFNVSEPTVAQRIVRAKWTLAMARVPFEVPQGAGLASRLSRSSAFGGRDGLGANPRALRGAGPDRTVAGCRIEPRRRRRDGVRAGSGPRARRGIDLGAVA